MPLPQVFIYICFVYWLLTTLVFIVWTALVDPIKPKEKMNLRRLRDLLMVTSAGAWLAMWLFRSIL